MRYPIWKSVFIGLVLGVVVSYGQPASAGSPQDRLFSRVYGSVACAYIANSMGQQVEGWTWDRIEKTYGLVDKWVPGERSATTEGKPILRRTTQRFGWELLSASYHREFGWGEDGLERYKLLASAIIRKGGRVNIEDLAREWVEKIDPSKFGFELGGQDAIIYNLLKSGIPPWEAGRYTTWPGSIGTDKMAAVLGIVNACRPDNAARDALDVTRIKDARGVPNDFSVEVSAALAAATAEAFRPDATVNSVIEVALAQLPNERGARGEVVAFLGLAQKAKDYKDLRVINADRYARAQGGRGAISAAIEVFGSALACFRLANGHPREAILNAINIGRDTDCRAYNASAMAGAMYGIEALPADWVETVEKASPTDPYTVDKRTPRQLAEGLYKAALDEHAKAKAGTSAFDSLLAK
jgi:ADP-ribosylglycohydrolase